MTTTQENTSEVEAPVITSISPSSATAGMHITITGTNFENVTQVTFGSMTMNVTESGGKVLVIAPAVISLGSVDVVAIEGNGLESLPETFTYIASPLLIRDNLSDTGGHGGSTGAHWISPDIICYGQGSLEYPTAVKDYSEYLNKPFTNGVSNKFYVRTKNIGSTAVEGSVELFYSPMSLFLTPPAWTQIVNPEQNAQLLFNYSTSIPAGKIAYTPTTFSFSGLPTGGHYCMLAIASLKGASFPRPAKFDNNGAMATWIQSNPNVSQRNLDFPAVSGNSANFDSTIGNNNDGPTEFYITVTPSTGSGNYPSGTTVDLNISDSRAPYTGTKTWDNSNGVTFKNIEISEQANGSSSEPLINVTITITMPAGNTFTGKTPLDVNYYQQPSDPGLYAEEANVIRPYTMAHPDNSAEAITESVFILGSCEIIFPAS